MADKLDWLNQHPLWFIFPTVNEVVTLNQLELSTPLQAVAARFPLSEDYLKALWFEGKFKDACTFCAYNTNPRIAVWWSYLCVLDLTQELLLNPAQKVKLEDIAKPRPLNIPEWCKLPEIDPLADAATQEQYAKLTQLENKLMSAQANMLSSLPPKLVSLFNNSVERTFVLLKERCGYDPRELLTECIDKLSQVKNTPEIDPNSPIFTAADELKQKIESLRLETVDLIKSVVPEEDATKQAQIAANCLDAVWAYLTSPNEDNAQRVSQLGNACPNQVECLLASIAFWSYGSLTPKQAQVIKTPPGLMANGVNGLLVKCATSVGGLYKPVERFERYFTLAFKALTNQSTWEDYVARNTSPHQELYAKVQQILLQQAAQQQKANTQRMASQLGPEATPGSSAIITPGNLSGNLASTSDGSFASGLDSNLARNSAPSAALTQSTSLANNLAQRGIDSPGASDFARLTSTAAQQNDSLNLSKRLTPHNYQGPTSAPATGAISGDTANATEYTTSGKMSSAMAAKASGIVSQSAHTPPAMQIQSPSLTSYQSQRQLTTQAPQSPQTQKVGAQKVATNDSVEAQRQAAERELQARLAQVRAEVNRRFKGK